MNLFDFSLRLKGFPIDQARRTLKSIQQKDDIEFEHYLTQKKQDIVAFHLKHNPYYQTFAKDANPKDWNSIPVMTKRDLQLPLKDRLSEGFTVSNTYFNKTSGSSGNPLIFVKDKFCHALTWSIIQDRFGWYGLDFNHSKQARFYGIPLNKKGYYKERIKDFLSKRFRFSIFDLSDSMFEQNLKKFQSTKFDYINGLTSAIVQFAKFLKQKQVVLKSICPTLKACLVTSEMLFDDDRLLLETWFGVPVINEYGASELGIIAFQNPENEWQITNESLFIEILDENNMPVALGEEGKIVITSLYNKAHPFLRYQVGDLGMLSKKSTLKKPILKKLIGRANDIVVLPSGKKATGHTFYYVTKSIVEDDGNVKEFVIEQIKTNTFKIKYVSTLELSEKKEHIIKKEIENYLEGGLAILFERHDKLQRQKSGKLKQFSSLLSQNL